jgi:hypothetical protein
MFTLDSPFCRVGSDRIHPESEFAVAFLDALPVAHVRRGLASKFCPDGFNIGLNNDASAGQTVMHADVHIIPRRNGDVTDPRGGVR